MGVDDNITVKNNKLTNGVIGIELENTTNSFVSGNKLTNNVTGILVVVLPGLPTTSTEHAVIERNVIRANNLPNPFPPPPPFFDDLQLLPSGSGVLNVGGDDITMRDNVITHNDSFGIGIVENPFGFGPPDDNRVVSNTVLKNAGDPDARAFLSADIAYDGRGVVTALPTTSSRPTTRPASSRASPAPDRRGRLAQGRGSRAYSDSPAASRASRSS